MEANIETGNDIIEGGSVKGKKGGGAWVLHRRVTRHKKLLPRLTFCLWLAR